MTPKPWHTLSAEEAIAILTTDIHAGLEIQEVVKRQTQYGPNSLPSGKKVSLLKVIAHQFMSPLIYLLLAAAGIALYLGEVKDSIVIMVVVFLNAVIGAIQEGRAERSIDSLRKLSTLNVRAIRGGKEIVCEAIDLVPGDIALLAAGDAVPADCRLLTAQSLETSEAILTGESMPVAKDELPCPLDASLGDRTCMLYSGTYVTAGRASAVVVATGSHSEIGRLAVQTAEAVDPMSPLEQRIDRFSKHIVVAALILFASIMLIGWLRSLPMTEVFMVAISQMVSMVPEGLPIAMTIALAVGVQRMAKRGVIIRRLAAVEALGSISVICSDKTGTLTRNEMTVTTLWLADGRMIEVSGSGYEPQGYFRHQDQVLNPSADNQLKELLIAAALCNDAALLPPDAEDSRWRPVGDPTEAALLTLALKAGLPQEVLKDILPRHDEIPFESATKMMATSHIGDSRRCVFIKGAFEEVITLCGYRLHAGHAQPLDWTQIKRISKIAHELAERALRVLAFAVVDGHGLADGRGNRRGYDSVRGNATFLGLVGQIDPPRLEVRDAVAACRRAGIRPVMITGDHKATALAIAQILDIYRSGDLVTDGRELSALSDADLKKQAPSTAVFARVHPSEKQRIVAALQANRQVVAMTGDGVNDAPALAGADVGVAMGITGTEVAKSAAKMIITDDNFATIVAGIEEGRLVHRNLKKAVLYLVATSMAEVLVLLLSLIAGYPPPLAAVQILWINLVTEGTVTVNLIMEPLEGDEMHRRPVRPHEALINRDILARIALMTPLIAAIVLGWFVHRLREGIEFAQVQTETFTLLAVTQWFNVLNCRSSTKSSLTTDILRNKWLLGGLLVSNLAQIAVVYWRPLGDLFHTVPIRLTEVFKIGLVGSTVLWVEEIRKCLVRRRLRRSALFAVLKT
ncbi:MAG: HAD-IC family P-type ATPase [Deltaproteobacteria bacterium]|nr:HAD-IC family P-type ATPase [Deltaproteobacteria bacterium]